MRHNYTSAKQTNGPENAFLSWVNQTTGMNIVTIGLLVLLIIRKFLCARAKKGQMAKPIEVNTEIMFDSHIKRISENLYKNLIGRFDSLDGQNASTNDVGLMIARTLEKSKKPIDIELGDAKTLVKDQLKRLSLLKAYNEVDRPLFISKVCK